jgi:hypothetical protein
MEVIRYSEINPWPYFCLTVERHPQTIERYPHIYILHEDISPVLPKVTGWSPKYRLKWKFKFVRWSVGQSVLVSGTPLGLQQDFKFFCVFLSLFSSFTCKAPSLTRWWVCSLQWNHSMVWIAQDHNHNLLSHLRLPRTWRARFLRNRVAQLCPPGTGSHFCLSLGLAGLQWG